jgi:hypothetical protein
MQIFLMNFHTWKRLEMNEQCNAQIVDNEENFSLQQT